MRAPGVLAVLTGRDMLADGLKPIPHAVRTGHPADIQLDNTDGSPPFIPPHYPMATDEVRHVGDIVAMVVASESRRGEGCGRTRRGGLRGTAGGGAFPRRPSLRVRRAPGRMPHRISASMPRWATRRRPTRRSPPRRTWCGSAPRCSASPA